MANFEKSEITHAVDCSAVAVHKGVCFVDRQMKPVTIWTKQIGDEVIPIAMSADAAERYPGIGPDDIWFPVGSTEDPDADFVLSIDDFGYN